VHYESLAVFLKHGEMSYRSKVQHRAAKDRILLRFSLASLVLSGKIESKQKIAGRKFENTVATHQ
jgi:hypothetical protein